MGTPEIGQQLLCMRPDQPFCEGGCFRLVYAYVACAAHHRLDWFPPHSISFEVTKRETMYCRDREPVTSCHRWLNVCNSAIAVRVRTSRKTIQCSMRPARVAVKLVSEKPWFYTICRSSIQKMKGARASYIYSVYLMLTAKFRWAL